MPSTLAGIATLPPNARLEFAPPRQVCNGARQLQHTIITAYGQVHLSHRSSDETLPCFIQFAELAHFAHTHIGVTNNGVQSLLTSHRSLETSDSESFALLQRGNESFRMILLNDHCSIFDNPRRGLRCKCQCGRTMGRRFAFDIW